MEKDVSIWAGCFDYRMGKIVKPNYFNENLDAVCAEGIHYFKTREAALSWFYRENGNFPDGNLTAWHENGQKLSEGMWKDGYQDGVWMEWQDNGKNF